MRNFIELYQPKEAWIINLTLKKEIGMKKTIIKIIPIFELI